MRATIWHCRAARQYASVAVAVHAHFLSTYLEERTHVEHVKEALSSIAPGCTASLGCPLSTINLHRSSSACTTQTVCVSCIWTHAVAATAVAPGAAGSCTAPS